MNVKEGEWMCRAKGANVCSVGVERKDLRCRRGGGGGGEKED